MRSLFLSFPVSRSSAEGLGTLQNESYVVIFPYGLSFLFIYLLYILHLSIFWMYIYIYVYFDSNVIYHMLCGEDSVWDHMKCFGEKDAINLMHLFIYLLLFLDIMH